MMRKFVFGFLGLVALQAPALALAAPNATCAAVSAEWRDAAFAAPAKPAQARVLGRAGYETSGPELRQMVQAIHQACSAGNPAVAEQQAAVAEALLHNAKGGN